jgi:DNA repair ATPase RecN
VSEGTREEDGEDEGLRGRLSRQGEEALGKLTEEIVGNPLVSAAVARAFGAREKAVQAQEAAMGALGVPSAADVERLTRRLRSVSQRLEGIEDIVDHLDARLEGIEGAVDRLGQGLERVEALDGRLEAVDRVDARLASLEKTAKKLDQVDRRLRDLAKADGKGSPDTQVKALETRLDEVGRDVAAVREAVAPGLEPPPRSQERLTVSEG